MGMRKAVDRTKAACLVAGKRPGGTMNTTHVLQRIIRLLCRRPGEAARVQEDLLSEPAKVGTQGQQGTWLPGLEDRAHVGQVIWGGYGGASTCHNFLLLQKSRLLTGPGLGER